LDGRGDRGVAWVTAIFGRPTCPRRLFPAPSGD
jgi:hypothetical protein